MNQENAPNKIVEAVLCQAEPFENQILSMHPGYLQQISVMITRFQ